MSKAVKVKGILIRKLHEILDEKIKEFEEAILIAKESGNNDTKSSAGDKFETGRAMMHIELEKYDAQLNNTLLQKQILSDINSDDGNNCVKQGCLVYTTKDNFFISLALGKTEFENIIYHNISLASPIGNTLRDRIVGELVNFRDQKFTITAIE